LAFVGLLLRDSWQHWFASDFVGIIAVATVTAFFSNAGAVAYSQTYSNFASTHLQKTQ
jgi:hypothetical protein